MNIRLLSTGIVLAATVVLTGCGNKPTQPINNSQDGNGTAKEAITSVRGNFTVTKEQCYFLTTDADAITYSLAFTDIKAPNFANGSFVTVNGFLSGDVIDKECGFRGPQLVVQSIFANGAGNQKTRTDGDAK